MSAAETRDVALRALMPKVRAFSEKAHPAYAAVDHPWKHHTVAALEQHLYGLIGTLLMYPEIKQTSSGGATVGYDAENARGWLRFDFTEYGE